MRRRTFLLGAGAATLTGCASPRPPAVTTAPQPPPTTTTATTKPEPITTEVVHSTARGTEVTLVVTRPAGAVDRELPVCVALHGRGANARMILDLGVPALLDSAPTPFAMVGLDGGDSYWVARDPADDPQRMLTDELPGWLAERGLATTPFAAFGLSMGAYGALNYVRGTAMSAAVLSPALFLSWPDARARNVFAGQQAWAATDPLQHTDALDGDALGVWCGTGDPFHPAATRLAELTNPQVSRFTPGAHDNDYWLGAMPEVVTFLAERAA